MAVLHVKAGPSNFSLTRNLKYKISTAKLRGLGDNGTKLYRGRIALSGTVQIEDEADAVALLSAAAADGAFTLVGASAAVTLTLKSIKCFEVDTEFGDGSKDGDIAIYTIGFEAEVATDATIATTTAYT